MSRFRNMSMGIKYYNPSFKGTPMKPTLIVDNQLSHRRWQGGFAENPGNAVRVGAEQYLILPI